MCHVSYVTCHLSRVTSHLSLVTCQKKVVVDNLIFLFIYLFSRKTKLDKVVELVGGGSVINGALPVFVANGGNIIQYALPGC